MRQAFRIVLFVLVLTGLLTLALSCGCASPSYSVKVKAEGDHVITELEVRGSL